MKITYKMVKPMNVRGVTMTCVHRLNTAHQIASHLIIFDFQCESAFTPSIRHYVLMVYRY